MSMFSDLVNTLTTAGLSGPVLTSTISAIAGNSPKAAVRAACVIILANSSNPTVIKDELTKMAEIPNLPSAVNNLLPELAAATTPAQVTQMVQQIENAISASTGFLGF